MIQFGCLSSALPVDELLHHRLTPQDRLAALFCMTGRSVIPHAGKLSSASFLSGGGI